MQSIPSAAVGSSQGFSQIQVLRKPKYILSIYYKSFCVQRQQSKGMLVSLILQSNLMIPGCFFKTCKQIINKHDQDIFKNTYLNAKIANTSVIR